MDRKSIQHIYGIKHAYRTSQLSQNAIYWILNVSILTGALFTRDNNMRNFTIKRLLSPWYEYDEPTSQCLSFKYTILAHSGFCAIYVYREMTNTRSLLITIGYHGDDKQTWRDAFTDVGFFPRSRVSFEVSCTSRSTASVVEAGVDFVRLDKFGCEEKCKWKLPYI